MTAKPTRYLSSQIKYDYFKGAPTSPPVENGFVGTSNKRAKKCPWYAMNPARKSLEHMFKGYFGSFEVVKQVIPKITQ